MKGRTSAPAAVTPEVQSSEGGLAAMKQKKGTMSIKAVGEGKATVVFATMEAWDKDGEWTEQGAFGEQIAKIAGAHDWRVPGLGKATIRESGNDAIAELEFNLDIHAAKDWFTALKYEFDNRIPSEFSYGFDVTAEEYGERDGRKGRILKALKVHEVSPVMIGAGVNTRTLAAKGAGMTMDEQEEIALDYLDRVKKTATLRNEEGGSVANLEARMIRFSEKQSEVVTLLKTTKAERNKNDAPEPSATIAALAAKNAARRRSLGD